MKRNLGKFVSLTVLTVSGIEQRTMHMAESHTKPNAPRSKPRKEDELKKTATHWSRGYTVIEEFAQRGCCVRSSCLSTIYAVESLHKPRCPTNEKAMVSSYGDDNADGDAYLVGEDRDTQDGPYVRVGRSFHAIRVI